MPYNLCFSHTFINIFKIKNSIWRGVLLKKKNVDAFVVVMLIPLCYFTSTWATLSHPRHSNCNIVWNNFRFITTHHVLHVTFTEQSERWCTHTQAHLKLNLSVEEHKNKNTLYFLYTDIYKLVQTLCFLIELDIFEASYKKY